MASYRIEIVQDATTRLYRAELYFPSTSNVATAATLPIYQTREEAEQRIQQMLAPLLAQPDRRDLDPEVSP